METVGILVPGDRPSIAQNLDITNDALEERQMVIGGHGQGF